MKHTLFTLSFLAIATAAMASDFTVDKITYEITSQQTVSIVSADSTIQFANLMPTVTHQGITYSVTSIGEHAFASCYSLSSVTIPSSVTSIEMGAFEVCSSLTSIIIPNSVTSIGNHAFYGCESLAAITLSDNLTHTNGQTFNGTAFYKDPSNWEDGVLYLGNCLLATKSDIAGEYSIKAGTRIIDSSAFSNCGSLTAITIPNSVTTIEWEAFNYCTSLSTINYTGTMEQWDKVIKGDKWNYNIPAKAAICTDGCILLLPKSDDDMIIL
jgi:hypothetical protein